MIDCSLTKKRYVNLTDQYINLVNHNLTAKTISETMGVRREYLSTYAHKTGIYYKCFGQGPISVENSSIYDTKLDQNQLEEFDKIIEENQALIYHILHHGINWNPTYPFKITKARISDGQLGLIAGAIRWLTKPELQKEYRLSTVLGNSIRWAILRGISVRTRNFERRSQVIKNLKDQEDVVLCPESELLSKTIAENMLHYICKTQTERTVNLMYRRFCEEMTLQECSFVHNISRERVRQIESRFLNQIRGFIRTYHKNITICEWESILKEFIILLDQYIHTKKLPSSTIGPNFTKKTDSDLFTIINNKEVLSEARPFAKHYKSYVRYESLIHNFEKEPYIVIKKKSTLISPDVITSVKFSSKVLEVDFPYSYFYFYSICDYLNFDISLKLPSKEDFNISQYTSQWRGCVRMINTEETWEYFKKIFNLDDNDIAVFKIDTSTNTIRCHKRDIVHTWKDGE